MSPDQIINTCAACLIVSVTYLMHYSITLWRK